MDNASKAIVIAGAALIAVLVVSLAVMMFNSAQNTVETGRKNVQMQSVVQFNQQFEKYFGKDRSREQAKALARLVKVSNADSSNPTITCPEPSTFDDASAGDRYEIDATYGDGGYISTITIK